LQAIFLEMQMKPRYYQQEAHDSAWDYLRTKPGNPLIVLPTGAGKSLTIAMLIEQAVAYDARVIVLQHRKELIEQNAEKIQILCPGVDIGVNSAGLKTRHYDHPVIFAGIQSVYRNAVDFGRRELVLIDEAHLVNDSDDSMFGRFLGDLMAINSKSRVVGLTATPYRTGEGKLCGPNKMFQGICYEMKTGRLIDEGYLCRLTNKAGDAQADMSEVRVSRGDYVESEMQAAFLEVVTAACQELITKAADRKSILVFSSGVEHAKMIASTIEEMTGETVRSITGETLPIERSQWLNDFKDGRLRWLVNCNVLTTGFDAPRIDAIAVLRATMSPGLFAQIVGRGLRKHESKEDCLILDFGGNIQRHGNLDSDEYGAEKEKSDKPGDAPFKNCPNCEEPSAISALIVRLAGLSFHHQT
jgi:DNA repair protein RadD